MAAFERTASGVGLGDCLGLGREARGEGGEGGLGRNHSSRILRHGRHNAATAAGGKGEALLLSRSRC